MPEEIAVPRPHAQPVTTEQRFATIAEISAAALYACAGRMRPLETLEVAGFRARIAAELKAIPE